MKHTHALAIAFVGGLIVCAPQWIVPLLPSDYAKAVDTISHRLAEPQTYWRLAATWFLVNLFYACFLAWNEEREEVVRLSPALTCIYGGHEIIGNRCKVYLEIINSAAQTSIGEWQARCLLPDNRALVSSGHYFHRTPATDETNRQNLAIDTTTIVTGGRRDGWVAFDILSTEYIAGLAEKTIEVSFRDHTGTPYAVSSRQGLLPRWKSKSKS